MRLLLLGDKENFYFILGLQLRNILVRKMAKNKTYKRFMVNGKLLNDFLHTLDRLMQCLGNQDKLTILLEKKLNQHTLRNMHHSNCATTNYIAEKIRF